MDFKWSDLEKWLENQKFPKSIEALKEPGWVEQFVRNMLSNAMPETRSATDEDVEVSFNESEQFLVLTFFPPAGSNIRKLRIQTREDAIRISGLPNGGSKEIELPKLVRAKQCRAYMKDGAVKIKMRKRIGNRSWTEYSIRSDELG